MAHGLHWDEADYAAYLRRRGTAQPEQDAAQDEADDTPEATFQAQVIALAKRNGFLVYHTHDSRKSEPGFPDLVLLGRSLLFVETKSATGKLTKEQAWWLEMLRHAGQETAIWRPVDWPTIEARLAED